MTKDITAALLIIGNEILSGRTIDQNLNYLAKELSEMGIILSEVRVVRDDESQIINSVNELRANYDYIFTSGGIGATHDDITIASVAKALNLKLVQDSKIAAILKSHYKDKLNDKILKMCMIPEGASLIDNEITAVPGFTVNNIFVLAGIPRIFQSMFTASKKFLKTGEKIHAKTITSYATESSIAHYLEKLQNNYSEIEIGSYPFRHENKPATSIVFRGINKQQIKEAAGEYDRYLKEEEITQFEI